MRGTFERKRQPINYTSACHHVGEILVVTFSGTSQEIEWMEAKIMDALEVNKECA